MRIPVEIFYISFFYFLLPMLYFPWNACQCGLRERESSLQPGNNISEAPSPHSALQGAPSFSQAVTQKLLYLKSCESTLQHKPNFPLFTEILKISNSQTEQRSFTFYTLRAFHICNTMAPPYRGPGPQRMPVYLSL